MPSPNSQNLRSAPQKQPIPNMAVSKPMGYGPLSGRRKMKYATAVGIGVDRPGSASAADGISSFFLNMNMAASPVIVAPIYAPYRRSAPRLVAAYRGADASRLGRRIAHTLHARAMIPASAPGPDRDPRPRFAPIRKPL